MRFAQFTQLLHQPLHIYKRKITEWTPYKTRPAGRTRLRWRDQVEEDLKRMKIIGWRAKVEDRQEWNRIVEQTKTHPGLYSQ
jgi:hypothetical protein